MKQRQKREQKTHYMIPNISVIAKITNGLNCLDYIQNKDQAKIKHKNINVKLYIL